MDTAVTIVFIHVGITVTNLRYEQPSRTIICTTTGGPATIITWMKDGTRLSIDGSAYQSSQVVLDTVSATYENRLSFTALKSDSLSGIYSCLVQNLRGNSSSELAVTGSDDIGLAYSCACM